MTEKKVANQPEVQPAPAPTVAPSPASTQAASAATPTKKGGNLKNIAAAAAAVALIAGSVLGYGFYNGSRIKKYAEDSEKIFSVTDVWSNSFTGSNMSQVKKDIAKVKDDSTNSLALLSKKSAPAKAKKLNADMIEYFTLSKKIATDVEVIVDWAVEIETIGKNFSNFSAINDSSPEAMAASIDAQKKEIDAVIVKMDALNVPESLKDQHAAFKKLLKSISPIYAKLSDALRTDDMDGVTAASSEFTSALSGMDAMESPEKSIAETFEEDGDKLDKLKTTINSEIAELKKTGFSL